MCCLISDPLSPRVLLITSLSHTHTYTPTPTPTQNNNILSFFIMDCTPKQQNGVPLQQQAAKTRLQTLRRRRRSRRRRRVNPGYVPRVGLLKRIFAPTRCLSNATLQIKRTTTQTGIPQLSPPVGRVPLALQPAGCFLWLLTQDS